VIFLLVGTFVVPAGFLLLVGVVCLPIEDCAVSALLLGMNPTLARTRAGFTMIELTVVATLIGVLSVTALPKYRHALERARATQAFSTMAQIQASQERYAIQWGRYSRRLQSLDLDGSLPLGFGLATLESGNWETGFRLVLRRDGASNGYGEYTIVWTENGFRPGPSTIPDALFPTGYTRKMFEQTQGETLSSR
jgi:prepilin-type N-terminal cleavage/methylation domain-containing protein